MKKGDIFNTIRIENILWYNNMKASLGIIQGFDINTEELKTFIGVAEGVDEILDIKNILNYGSKIDGINLINHKEEKKLFSLIGKRVKYKESEMNDAPSDSKNSIRTVVDTCVVDGKYTLVVVDDNNQIANVNGCDCMIVE